MGEEGGGGVEGRWGDRLTGRRAGGGVRVGEGVMHVQGVESRDGIPAGAGASLCQIAEGQGSKRGQWQKGEGVDLMQLSDLLSGPGRSRCGDSQGTGSRCVQFACAACGPVQARPCLVTVRGASSTLWHILSTPYCLLCCAVPLPACHGVAAGWGAGMRAL
jgi:hypothetical protein